MTDLVNQSMPDNPFVGRLPGTRPVGRDEWLVADDIYAGRMAERDALIATRREAVYRCLPQALPAAHELLDRVVGIVLSWPGFSRDGNRITRADGVTVDLDADEPLISAARLVEEDLCILQKLESEHVLTAAVLCYPAGWMLAEKIGRPLMAIHIPVDSYDPNIGKRVQRMFDMVRPDAPICRGNLLFYDDANLHTPRAENNPRPAPVTRAFRRAERQCIVALPQSGAAAFTIHTYIVRNPDAASGDA